MTQTTLEMKLYNIILITQGDLHVLGGRDRPSERLS